MRVYLDNSATTRIDKEVLRVMNEAECDAFGNASSIHGFGREAANLVDNARASIARLINADASEIYFTSGGTESDNWAIKGVMKANAKTGKHLITTEIEHPAVLASCGDLVKDGFEVSFAKPNADGIITLEEIKSLVQEDTVMVSVMYANNEIGSIQPIKEIGEFCKSEGIIFHTDAVQAAGSINLDVKRDKIDLLSLSAHKFHGPKGVGILYVRKGVRIARLMSGGHQERTLRAGTTNTACIVGMAKALELSVHRMEENNAKTKELRDYFVTRVQKEIPNCHLNGGVNNRLVSNANLSFDYIEGESILISLDLEGIAVSSGSACSSGSLEPSHVILAIGAKPEEAHSSIRFSFGADNTIKEVDYTVEKLKAIVNRLRKMSPLFKVEKSEVTYV